MWYRRSGRREEGSFMEEVGARWLRVEDGHSRHGAQPLREGTEATGTQGCINLANPYSSWEIRIWLEISVFQTKHRINRREVFQLKGCARRVEAHLKLYPPAILLPSSPKHTASML